MESVGIQMPMYTRRAGPFCLYRPSLFGTETEESLKILRNDFDPLIVLITPVAKLVLQDREMSFRTKQGNNGKGGVETDTPLTKIDSTDTTAEDGRMYTGGTKRENTPDSTSIHSTSDSLNPSQVPTDACVGEKDVTSGANECVH